MHNHCINQLLNLEGVIVKKIIHADSFVKIYLETKPSQQICPHCGASTKKIHDYRSQTIKDLPLQLTNTPAGQWRCVIGQTDTFCLRRAGRQVRQEAFPQRDKRSDFTGP